MSVTYGFYNSIKGDRKYNALEMSSIFDGIIVDGVYMSIGDALNVKSSGGMGITVGIGRAWFNHTWTLNDSLLPLTLANSDVLLNRIDAIVLEVNNNTEVRKNTIKILKGTPSSKPVKPTMTEGELLNQHPLAYISIPAGATSISQSNIENAVGTSACPYVTGVLKGMDIDKLVAQWGAQWAEWLSSNTDAWKAFMSDNTNEWKSFMAKNKNEWSALINGNTSEFETWFEHMKDQLSEDAAGNLQLQVDNLNNAALGGDFVLKGSPVSVEYMGANRIASITAYGENAQGGTTEAPMALTGVDSVFVGGNNLFSAKLVADKVVDVKGFTSYDKSNYYSTDTPIPVMKNTTYRLSSSGVLFRGNLHFKNKKGKTLSQIFNFNTFTVPNDADYIMFTVLKNNVTDPNAPIMLNVGTEPLPYEPYQGSVTQLPIPRSLRRVGDVKDKCVTRQDYESAEKLVVTYNVGFVELDGTEGIEYQSAYNRFAYTLPSTAVNDSGFCSHYKKLMTSAPGEDKYIVIRPEAVYFYDSQYTNADAFNAYLAAQKAAGTPVQVAYQLATPEVYATDPVDFDNAAGPLTVLTGGELEAAFKSADKVVESRIDFVEDTLNEQGQAIAEKAPISHSSDKSTYGLGSGSQFGHVKLSDATASGSNAGQGIAATPSAVNQVNARVSTVDGIARAAMPKSGGTFTGNVLASSANEAGAFLRNISVQNSASQLQYTNFIIMVRK